MELKNILALNVAKYVGGPGKHFGADFHSPF
jgi:hypothetical protein